MNVSQQAPKCANPTCFDLASYSYKNKRFYRYCQLHGLGPSSLQNQQYGQQYVQQYVQPQSQPNAPPKCSHPGCTLSTKWSVGKQKHYSQCEFHGLPQNNNSNSQGQFQQYVQPQNQPIGPKCSHPGCNSSTKWSVGNQKYYSQCQYHGLSNGLIQQPSTTSHNISSNNNNNMCELEQWIRSPFKPLDKSRIDTLQPQYENVIMPKYPKLSFWIDVVDIAKASNTVPSLVSDHLYNIRKTYNDQHTTYNGNSVVTIRFADNNGAILYDHQMQIWLHAYLQKLL